MLKVLSQPSHFGSYLLFTIAKSFPVRYFMTLYLKGYQKYNKSNSTFFQVNLEISFFTCLILISLPVQGHTIRHLKALSIRGWKTEKPMERFLIIGLDVQTENRLIISDWVISQSRPSKVSSV